MTLHNTLQNKVDLIRSEVMRVRHHDADLRAGRVTTYVGEIAASVVMTDETQIALDRVEGEMDRLSAYLAAHQYRPGRAEALCHLARYQRERQRYALALLFAQAAAQIARPDDVLFVDATVYEWRARDEWSIAAYWCGDKALSARLCRELLADPRLPPEQRERVRANLAFSDGSA